MFDNNAATDWDILASLESPAEKGNQRNRKPRHRKPAKASKPAFDKAPDKELDAIAFNRAAEKEFLRLADRLLEEGGGEIEVEYLVGYAAYELDVSPATVKRYMAKHSTHPSAPFRVTRGVIVRRA